MSIRQLIVVCLGIYVSLGAGSDLVGQDRVLRIATYNLLDKPTNSSQDADLRAIIGAMGDAAIFGEARNLDVMAFQEGPQSAGSYSFVESDFETVFGGDYEVFFATSDFSGDRTGIVYNASRLNLISAQSVNNLGFTHSPSLVTFRPIDGGSEDEFSVISVHLKAGTTASDANTRAAETNALGTLVNTLPPNANFVIAGDFNMKGSDESAWTGLVNIGAMETINAPFGLRIANWNNNLAFQPFHSQEITGTVGGIDDRFDMQLGSAATMDDVGFEYVRGSLSVLGNNGTHTLNGAITSGNGAIAVQGNLLDFSDHLPVFADYRYGAMNEATDSILNVVALANFTVQPAGPRPGTTGTSFLNIEGDGNGNFASFGVIEFDFNGVIAEGVTAENLKDVGLELLQSNAGFSRNGPYSVYVTSAAAALIPIDADISYQVGNNGIACVPASLANNAIFVTKYPGVHYTPSGSLLPDGTIDDVAFYGPAFETSLLDAINAGGVLRLLIVPEQDDTAATFAGNTNSVWSGPTIFGDYSMRASEPMIVVGETFSVTRGNFVSGNITSLAASDNIDLSVNRSSADIQSRTELEIQGTSPFEVPSELEITLEGSVFARSVVTQRIELFDYVLGTWEQVDLRDASRFSDSVVNVSPTGDVSRFVESKTRAIAARIRFQSLNPRQQFSSNTDLFQWTITP